MKLNLDASDEEIRENLEHEKRKDWLKFILGAVVVLLISGGIWVYISSLQAQGEEARQQERQKIEALRQRGVAVAGEITKGWEIKSNNVTVGYEAEYQFVVKGQTYQGKGRIKTNPQLLTNDIRVIYDPENPANNLTATGLEMADQAPASTSSGAAPNDYKWLIRIVVVAVISLFFLIASFLYNKIADLFNRKF